MADNLSSIDRALAACLAGRHVPGVRRSTDTRGVEHARCRRCGCELCRLPTIGRWYRSGWIG